MSGNGDEPVNPEALTGPQRVAAFLLSLDRDAAAAMMRHLSDDVVTEVVEAMGSVDGSFAGVDLMKQLHGQVAVRVHKPPGVQPATGDELEDLLVRGVGADRADVVLNQIQNRRLHERPFALIETEPPSKVARLLESESPAAMALVLAHLDPLMSAVVLAGLEVEHAMDVVRRMASIQPPSFDVLILIARELKTRMDKLGAAPIERTQDEAYQTIADMLNMSETEIEKGILEGLGDVENDAELAAEIRDHMFTWNDVGTIDKRAMQKVLASVDTRTLSIALKAAEPDVEANIMDNLSSRVREMVKEERDLAGAMPMSEVASARNERFRCA
ncbi:MAG: FliG C-terminal domain-containing protein, partial [Planctomycetota bacterium]